MDIANVNKFYFLCKLLKANSNAVNRTSCFNEEKKNEIYILIYCKPTKYIIGFPAHFRHLVIQFSSGEAQCVQI